MASINLKFVEVPVRSSDPIVRAREALNARLAEQVQRARNPELTRELRKGKGEDRKTIQQAVSPWFTQRADGKVILTVKAGGKKATAIEIPSIEEFETHITALMKQVSEGALDRFLGRSSMKKPVKVPAQAKKRAA